MPPQRGLRANRKIPLFQRGFYTMIHLIKGMNWRIDLNAMIE
ncbi:MAG: hypothetical protein AVDCRST_MAG56-223 [uncultured Cytophagales bacterium]|uniref:Uncharacterized protein n=1 Tax=uncultured Cytophagales bacterium TaxID=158755 RepID=A0A6J4H7Z4_9SPHI|nr:MAG: hypothetical protein AVDCRST_MAG56-223 [uncultured Cytophagales bacterium]